VRNGPFRHVPVSLVACFPGINSAKAKGSPSTAERLPVDTSGFLAPAGSWAKSWNWAQGRPPLSDRVKTTAGPVTVERSKLREPSVHEVEVAPADALGEQAAALSKSTVSQMFQALEPV
jgi:hypothetical protein